MLDFPLSCQFSGVCPPLETASKSNEKKRWGRGRSQPSHSVRWPVLSFNALRSIKVETETEGKSSGEQQPAGRPQRQVTFKEETPNNNTTKHVKKT